jgi:hypothetical protein
MVVVELFISLFELFFVRVYFFVRRLQQSLGANPGTLMAQLALQYSALNHCATRETFQSTFYPA